MAANESGSPPITTRATTDSLILVLDGDAHASAAVVRSITTAGYACHSSADSTDSCEQARALNARAIIADVASLHRGPADFLREAKASSPTTAIILTGADITTARALQWLRAGATDVVLKPFDESELLAAVEHSLQRVAVTTRGTLQHQAPVDALATVVGTDERLRHALDLARSASSVRSTVLIHGESGTGKSMLARAIHAASSRGSAPFIELACGSIPESLLESELFGHVKGAFTGALTDKKGRFLAADGGTIFLDEINSASPAMQLKLLRVLQEKRFEAVGSDTTISVDIRVIVASNQPLEQLVEKGLFRQDLFYRVHVLPIELPPLRSRPSDVDALAAHFLNIKSAELGRTILGFTPAAAARLREYSWPGNVRELENAIERATIVCTHAWIDSMHLPERITLKPRASEIDDTSRSAERSPLPFVHAASPLALDNRESGKKLSDALRDPERAAILTALDSSGWNRSRAADALGINRTTLYRKMRDLGLGAFRDAG